MAAEERLVDDGFGNAWVMCPHPKCDLQIVRPGKVQCSGYSNCDGDDYVTDHRLCVQSDRPCGEDCTVFEVEASERNL